MVKTRHVSDAVNGICTIDRWVTNVLYMPALCLCIHWQML